VKQRPAYLQAPTQLSTRRCSESELSDFDLIGEDKDQVPSGHDNGRNKEKQTWNRPMKMEAYISWKK